MYTGGFQEGAASTKPPWTGVRRGVQLVVERATRLECTTPRGLPLITVQCLGSIALLGAHPFTSQPERDRRCTHAHGAALIGASGGLSSDTPRHREPVTPGVVGI